MKKEPNIKVVTVLGALGTILVGSISGRVLYDFIYYKGDLLYFILVCVAACYAAYSSYYIVVSIKEAYSTSNNDDDVEDGSILEYTMLGLYVMSLVIIIRTVSKMIEV